MQQSPSWASGIPNRDDHTKRKAWDTSSPCPPAHPPLVDPEATAHTNADPQRDHLPSTPCPSLRADQLPGATSSMPQTREEEATLLHPPQVRNYPTTHEPSPEPNQEKKINDDTQGLSTPRRQPLNQDRSEEEDQPNQPHQSHASRREATPDALDQAPLANYIRGFPPHHTLYLIATRIPPGQGHGSLRIDLG